MEDIVKLVVQSYGVVGLIILSPMIAVVYLWKENKELNKQLLIQAADYSKRIEELGTRVVAAQAQRVDDAHKVVEKFVQLIAEQSERNKEVHLALDRIGDMVSMVAHNQNPAVRGVPK